VIGDAVQLNLQVEATRTREALEPAAATPADPASPSTPAQEPATP
jgi:hypothetical protein